MQLEVLAKSNSKYDFNRKPYNRLNRCLEPAVNPGSRIALWVCFVSELSMDALGEARFVHAQLLSRGRLFATAWTISHELLLSSGQEYGGGCRSLLQGIFPTQGSNPQLLRLLLRQADSLPLSHLGSPEVHFRSTLNNRKGKSLTAATKTLARFTTAYLENQEDRKISSRIKVH